MYMVGAYMDGHCGWMQRMSKTSQECKCQKNVLIDFFLINHISYDRHLINKLLNSLVTALKWSLDSKLGCG